MIREYSYPFTRRMVDIDDGAMEVWEGGDGPVTFVTAHPFLVANGRYPGGGLSDGLASIGRTIFVVPRGSGGSFAEDRREKLGMDVLVDDMDQVRRALGIARWIPSGYSCGGMTTLMYAIRYPDAVAGVVPICTAASYHYALQPDSLYASTSAAYARLDEIKRRAGMGEEYERARSSESLHNQDLIDTVLCTTHTDPNRNEVVVEEVLVGKWNYEPELAQIKAPTLILAGRYDGQAGSMFWSYKILVGIAGSELAVMNHSGHFPHEEEPEEFRRVIGEFVQRRVVPTL
jgi:proline iminopeptidase